MVSPQSYFQRSIASEGTTSEKFLSTMAELLTAIADSYLHSGFESTQSKLKTASEGGVDSESMLTALRYSNLSAERPKTGASSFLSYSGSFSDAAREAVTDRLLGQIVDLALGQVRELRNAMADTTGMGDGDGDVEDSFLRDTLRPIARVFLAVALRARMREDGRVVPAGSQLAVADNPDPVMAAAKEYEQAMWPIYHRDSADRVSIPTNVKVSQAVRQHIVNAVVAQWKKHFYADTVEDGEQTRSAPPWSSIHEDCNAFLEGPKDPSSG